MARFRNDDGGNDPYEMGKVKVIAATEKALLCQPAKDGTDSFWVPRSVLMDGTEVDKKGDDGELVVKTWWADKNGH